jgi:PAS domain S-box-containing protein
MVGKTDQNLFDSEIGNQYLLEDHQILESGLPILHQLENWLNLDGSYSWLDVSKLPIRNSMGEVIGILGVMEDITDRKRAEEALRQSELKNRSIFDNSQVGIFCSQVADGLVLEANQYFVNLTGYESADQVIGTIRTVDFYSPTDRQYVLEQLQQFGVVNNFEFQFWNRHGIPQWAMASVHLDPERQLIEGVILDVSDRKQAEANLRDSEERLRLALTAANQGLYDLDLKTGAAIVSPEYATMLGYNPAEFQETNAKWIERLHPDDLERTANVYLAYVAGEIADYKVEFRQRTQQGTWKWILSIGKIVAWDESGQPLRMLGTHTDIDERKCAEASLQAERLRLQLALEAAQMGTWSCNLQTGQLLWSDRAQEIFGFVPGTFPGDRDTFLDMVHPEDYHRVVEAISTTFEQGTPYDIEYRIHRLDGELRWIAVWGIIPESAIFTERQLVGVVTDISDRKQAEAALRQSEARLRATFNQAAVGIVQADRQGRFVQVNQKFCEIVAYPEAEILFKSFAEITHPDDLAADHANVQRLLADEVSTFAMEKRYIRKDGDVVWVTLAVALVRNPANEPEYFIGVIQDISDRKAAEAALIQAKQELEDRVEQRTIELRLSKETAEAANRAKSAFLANMSHELRTPLNAILGFSQLLNRNTALNANQKKQVGIINRSGEHLLNLINDILEMSKIEAGRVILNLKNFGLYQMLHSLKELFSLRAESKGLELRIQIAANVPEYIQTDESKLRQVLINLLSNAIKFTQAGSVTLRVSIASSSSGNQSLSGNAQSCLSFEVTDTGPGIEPNEQEILFEPFVQTKTGQKSLEGTGLGLPISRQFVQLMGGELTVYSIPGQGATFYFEIPVDLAGEEDLPLPQPTRKVIGLAPGQPVYRLLVVEDNSENRQFLIQLLQSVGFETREAENGQEAVALWQTWAPHLIWMDMRMPIMNGYEATRRVRELEQAQLSANATQSSQLPAIPTKILALTASAFEDERTAIMAAGCDDFVCKPATETTLFEKIAEYVGVRYLYQEETEAEKATNQPRSSSDQLSANALRVMPPTWIEQLQRAARMADEEVILQLLDLLPPAQTSLANALRELVSELRLDQLIELTVDALKI